MQTRKITLAAHRTFDRVGIEIAEDTNCYLIEGVCVIKVVVLAA